MSRLGVGTLIVMLLFATLFVSVNAQQQSYFKVLRVYWGTEQPIEVSPGDTATLSVVLRSESQYSIRSFKAELLLPDYFRAVGGGQRALAYYTGTISQGSVIRLDFSVFITKDAPKISYSTNLWLNYFVSDTWRYDLLEVEFEVTGKPSIKVTSMNASLDEGNQELSIIIQNEGDAAAESLKIVRIYSSGASAELKGSAILGRLEPGGKVIVPVQIYVPSDVKNGSLLTLIVEAACNGPWSVVYSFSKNLLIPIVIPADVEPSTLISCRFPGRAVTPGDAVQFQIRLKNPFDVKMRFIISVDHVPTGWTFSVKDTSDKYVTQVILDTDESADLVVEVTPPDTAKIGEEHRLLFNVKSFEGKLLESLPLDVTLVKSEEEVEEGVNIAVKFPEIMIEVGKILQYPITIINLGSVDRLLSLSVEPPTDWKAVFKYGTLEVSRLSVESGKSENLIIEATPPSTVSIGSYTIPVHVSSEDGAIYEETNLKATIVGSYVLSLEPSTLLTSVTAGSSTTFTAKITNTGYTPVTSLSLSVATTGGWDVSITPVRVDSLKPLESHTFTVVAKTTADTVAGDYLITLRALSDQAKSDQVQVRVTVTVPTSWGLIGVGIAAGMVIALMFAFIKFRRR